MTRRYRNPGLHQHQKDAYLSNAFGWVKSTRDDYDVDLYHYCHTAQLPFFVITQPRKYCRLEMSIAPIGARFGESARAMLADWAEGLLQGSSAPAKAKAVRFDDDSAEITGLEFEQAKKLADVYWRYLHGAIRDLRDEKGTA